MIQTVYSNGTVQTTGCGCCSSILSLEQDAEKIISHIKDNLQVAKEACDAVGISLIELVNEL